MLRDSLFKPTVIRRQRQMERADEYALTSAELYAEAVEWTYSRPPNWSCLVVGEATDAATFTGLVVEPLPPAVAKVVAALRTRYPDGDPGARSEKEVLRSLQQDGMSVSHTTYWKAIKHIRRNRKD